MYIRNAWYVAAFSSEVGRTPLARTYLEEPVVLYRTEAGQVVAMLDACPHRTLPLSLGKLVGDRIQCGYHGLEFNEKGHCIYEPETKQPLAWATVRTYPVEERYGWVFIWMGEPELADPAKVPTFHKKMVDENWDTVSGYVLIECGYRMIIDNLLDLSHLGYVHGTSLGNPDFAEKTEYSERYVEHPTLGRGVRFDHIVRDAANPEFYAFMDGNVDRWTTTEYYAPAHLFIRVGQYPAGTVDLEAEMESADAWEIYHSATPETETTSHDFWAHVREGGVVTGEAAEAIERQIHLVINEDVPVYTAQQRRVTQLGKGNVDVQPRGSLRADRSLWLARRIINQRLAQENGGGSVDEDDSTQMLNAAQSLPAI